MSPATRRTILRYLHLILSIPILGYIYGDPAEVQQYASGVRFIFVPVIILSGFWMYSGVAFAVIGLSLWLGALYFFNSNVAIVVQIALFIVRKLWLIMRARRSKIPA